jgi:signal transduction histidine kinase
MSGLAFLGYIIFFLHWRTIPPALLYSLVPFLLWATLRFGSNGAGDSVIVVAFFAIWGSAHGRGPFIGPDALQNVLSLQLFLLFAITPFMLLAVLVDERRQARFIEKELRGRLIFEQEKERSRIARDLHDDICQRLALLSMEIDHATRLSSDSPETAQEKLQEIRKHCSEITGDVQSLSHQLHSSKLESLGIEAAIRGFCREFSKLHEVNVEFTCRNVPKHVPKEVSVCLFRVAQEALQNAVKYSEVSDLTVELLTLEDEIHLAVTDEGVGFDVETVKRNQGLGLMSMQERVLLVHGALSVDSRPGKGTQILAVVPLDGRSPNDEQVKETETVTRIS